MEEIGSSGSYILAGSTYSEGATYDVWVLKLDSSGNIIWQKTYDAGNLEDVTAIRGTDDGGFILAGMALSETFGTSLNSDFWVLKLDSDGNVGLTYPGTWQKIYGGANYDLANSIQPTPDGGYVVAGHSANSEYFHAWVIKLDAGGNVTWNQSYGSEYLRPQSVQPTADGGYIMAGSILESNSSSTNFTDAWVLKLDSAGNITWKKAYGGESSDHEDSAEAIRQTTDGGYVLTGNTESSGAGKTDIWVLKLDESGEIDGCGVVKALESVEKLDPAPSINTAVPALVVTGTTIIGSSTAATVVEATLTQDGPCGPLVVEGIIDLPVTGQTECYDSSNGVIDCTDTGQDGEYQMGVAWPVPRFTVNGEGTIITDRLTGLSWATDAGMPSLGDGACAGGVLGEKTWQGALDYIECLNSGTGSTTFDGDYLGTQRLAPAE